MNVKNLMDCLKALQSLEIKNQADCARLTALFGLEVAKDDQAQLQLFDDEVTDAFPSGNRPESDFAANRPLPTSQSDGDSLLVVMDLIEQATTVTPTFSTETSAIAQSTSASEYQQPIMQPLFAPNFTRQNLLSIGSVYAEKGGLDEKTLMQDIAVLKPLLKIPRRVKPVIPNRIQLLVDVTEAMDPFLHDIKQFDVEISQMLGGSKIEKLYFQGCPQRGVGKNAIRLLDYHQHYLPEPGSKVICLSNLGLGYRSFSDVPSRTQEWLEFHQMLAQQDCSLIILTPYTLQTLALVLLKRLNIVYWDRTTTPSAILKRSFKAEAQIKDQEQSELPIGFDAIIAQYKTDFPQVYQLSRSVALAVRVTPTLLRHMRLFFCPDSGSEVEAAVWFSRLVSNRDIDGFTFHDEVAVLLRQSLSQDPDLYDGVWSQTARIHGSLTPTLKLEEEIYYLENKTTAEAKTRIKTLLQSVVNGMVVEKRSNLSYWAIRALGKFSAQTLAHEEAQMIGFAARLHLGLPIEFPNTIEAQDERVPSWINWILQESPTELFFTLYQEHLHINREWSAESDANTQRLSVPSTNPLVIYLKEGNVEQSFRKIEIPVNDGLYVPVSSHKLYIRSVDGNVSCLKTVQPKPTVFISYSHKDREWKDRLKKQIAVLEMAEEIIIWNDRKIDGGDKWYEDIKATIESLSVAIESASIVILLISADFILNEEVPTLLARASKGGLRIMPLIIKPCAWQSVDWLSRIQVRPKDGRALSDGNKHQIEKDLSDFAIEIRDLLKSMDEMQDALPPIKVDLSKLPNTGSSIFGRQEELARLDQAWDNPAIGVISFIAWGGVGKSALINYWLGRMHDKNFRGATQVYGWSFYSQGTRDNRQVSADAFINATFKWFGYQGEIPQSGHEKGIALAQLIGQSRTLLILDGLEPMQYPPGVNDGKLKDQSMIALLKSLSRANNGLCVITSRKKIADLRATENSGAPCYELGNLSLEAGVQLLKNADITGPQIELKKAVSESKGHALTLNLIASFLGAVYGGDIRMRDKIESIYDDEENGSHAKNIMASYESWFAETNQPELDILNLLGVFDRPASKEAVDVLKAEPVIPGVTERLQHLSFAKWKFAIQRLRELQLLAKPENKDSGTLDCHPLIREYFGKKLQQQNPSAFKAAHARLYEYYKNLPEKELPDTLEEMEPLFIAVTHGCLAGQYQLAYDEVFWQRISRREQYYILKQLGAFDSYMSVLSNFFAEPWQTVVSGLSGYDKEGLLSQAALGLRAVGRLFEAIQPMQAALAIGIEKENWKQSSVDTGNLCELFLVLGNVTSGVNYAEQSVTLADKSGDHFYMQSLRSTHANALHQSGQMQVAKKCFVEAEQIQQKRQLDTPLLYSLQGFQFCDLLLAIGQNMDVLVRLEKTIKIAQQNNWLLDIALDQLSFGKALMQQAIAQHITDFDLAMNYLHQAVAGLREAGTQDQLPHGLLARASLYTMQADFDNAWLDLEEVREIAEFGQMRLHLTDYHLEACRIIQAQGLASRQAEFDRHLEQATKLVEETGYHRRDAEVAQLRTLF